MLGLGANAEAAALLKRMDNLRAGIVRHEEGLLVALCDRRAWVDSLDLPPPITLQREDVHAFLTKKRRSRRIREKRILSQ